MDATEYPKVLIDQPEDGCIDETGWVEVTPTVGDGDAAVKIIEGVYPTEDRMEEETYVCDGEQEFLAPMHWEPCDECNGAAPDDCPGCEGSGTVPYEYDRWEAVDPQSIHPDRREKAKLFWIVKVVCKV